MSHSTIHPESMLGRAIRQGRDAVQRFCIQQCLHRRTMRVRWNNKSAEEKQAHHDNLIEACERSRRWHEANPDAVWLPPPKHKKLKILPVGGKDGAA